MIFPPSVRQREFPLITIYHTLSGYYDMAAGHEHVWSSAILLWWQIYYPSREFRGNRKKAWWETDSVPTQLSEALKRNKKGRKGRKKREKRQTYISRGDLQSTVRLTRWLPMAKTSVCHWLLASRVPRNPQFSITPPWPLKRKCRRFLESLSPSMRRPRSSLLLTRLTPVSPCCSLSVFLSSSFSPNPLFSTLFGSIKVKMYSFLWKANRKNTQTYCLV